MNEEKQTIRSRTKKSESRRSSILKRLDTCTIENFEGQNEGPRTPKRVSFAPTFTLREFQVSVSDESCSTNGSQHDPSLHPSNLDLDEVFHSSNAQIGQPSTSVAVVQSIASENHVNLLIKEKEIILQKCEVNKEDWKSRAGDENKTIMFTDMDDSACMDLTTNISQLSQSLLQCETGLGNDLDREKYKPGFSRRSSFSEESADEKLGDTSIFKPKVRLFDDLFKLAKKPEHATVVSTEETIYDLDTMNITCDLTIGSQRAALNDITSCKIMTPIEEMSLASVNVSLGDNIRVPGALPSFSKMSTFGQINSKIDKLQLENIDFIADKENIQLCEKENYPFIHNVPKASLEIPYVDGYLAPKNTAFQHFSKPDIDFDECNNKDLIQHQTKSSMPEYHPAEMSTNAVHLTTSKGIQPITHHKNFGHYPLDNNEKQSINTEREFYTHNLHGESTAHFDDSEEMELATTYTKTIHIGPETQSNFTGVQRFSEEKTTHFNSCEMEITKFHTIGHIEIGNRDEKPESKYFKMLPALPSFSKISELSKLSSTNENLPVGNTAISTGKEDIQMCEKENYPFIPDIKAKFEKQHADTLVTLQNNTAFKHYTKPELSFDGSTKKLFQHQIKASVPAEMSTNAVVHLATSKGIQPTTLSKSFGQYPLDKCEKHSINTEREFHTRNLHGGSTAHFDDSEEMELATTYTKTIHIGPETQSGATGAQRYSEEKTTHFNSCEMEMTTFHTIGNVEIGSIDKKPEAKYFKMLPALPLSSTNENLTVGNTSISTDKENVEMCGKENYLYIQNVNKSKFEGQNADEILVFQNNSAVKHNTKPDMELDSCNKTEFIQHPTESVPEYHSAANHTNNEEMELATTYTKTIHIGPETQSDSTGVQRCEERTTFKSCDMEITQFNTNGYEESCNMFRKTEVEHINIVNRDIGNVSSQTPVDQDENHQTTCNEINNQTMKTDIDSSIVYTNSRKLPGADHFESSDTPEISSSLHQLKSLKRSSPHGLDDNQDTKRWKTTCVNAEDTDGKNLSINDSLPLKDPCAYKEKNNSILTSSEYTRTSDKQHEEFKKSLIKDMRLSLTLSRRSFSLDGRSKTSFIHSSLNTSSEPRKLTKKDNCSFNKNTEASVDDEYLPPTTMFNLSTFSKDVSKIGESSSISQKDHQLSMVIPQLSSSRVAIENDLSFMSSNELDSLEDSYFEPTEWINNQKMPIFADDDIDVELDAVEQDIKSVMEKPSKISEIHHELGIDVLKTKKIKEVSVQDVPLSTQYERLLAKLTVITKIESLKKLVKDVESKINKTNQDFQTKVLQFANNPPKSWVDVMKAIKSEENSLYKNKAQEMFEACRTSAKARWKEHKTDSLLSFCTVAQRAHDDLKAEITDVISETERVVNLTDELDKWLLIGDLKEKENETNTLKNNCDQAEEKLTVIENESTKSLKRIAECKSETENVKARLALTLSLTEWAILEENENEMKFSFFFHSIILKITFNSSKEKIIKISLGSTLSDKSKPCAKLAHSLAMSSIDCEKLLSNYSDYNQMVQLLDNVSKTVCTYRQLVSELRLANIKHDLSICENRLTYVISSRRTRQRVKLETVICPKVYPNTLMWQATVLIGNLKTEEVTQALDHVQGGHQYITRALAEVENLINQR
ncbi:uncharacterized protein LOC131941801 [Physella acuta]|uniref:uncharacterized protein LOC131941801 n=1 Tax=Physella acuta TaxID=109671 RepID=UPI0027DDB103|nr:uncharacterized protein LOC131941801 [Physella acuta]